MSLEQSKKIRNVEKKVEGLESKIDELYQKRYNRPLPYFGNDIIEGTYSLKHFENLPLEELQEIRQDIESDGTEGDLKIIDMLIEEKKNENQDLEIDKELPDAA